MSGGFKQKLFVAHVYGHDDEDGSIQVQYADDLVGHIGNVSSWIGAKPSVNSKALFVRVRRNQMVCLGELQHSDQQ